MTSGVICSSLLSQSVTWGLQRPPGKHRIDAGWIDDPASILASASRMCRIEPAGIGSHPPSISATVRAAGEVECWEICSVRLQTAAQGAESASVMAGVASASVR